jgi:TonB family protein
MRKLNLLLSALLLLQPEFAWQASRVVPTRVVGLLYPRLALLAGIQGSVVVEAYVDENGTVRRTIGISGNPLLLQAARDSLQRWRFSGCSSAVNDCKIKITFQFMLVDGTCNVSECQSHTIFDLPDRVEISSKHALAIIN